MFKELETLKKSGGNAESAELKKKLKKSSEDVKNAEKNLEESIKQCGIEANKRANAEAELARTSGLIDLLTRTVTMMNSQGNTAGGLGGEAISAQGMVGQLLRGLGGSSTSATGMAGQSQYSGRGSTAGQKSTGSNKEVCQEWGTTAGCSRGLACRFSHPGGQGRLGGGQDCSFWLAGKCRYGEDYCNKGAHIEAKKGTRPY